MPVPPAVILLHCDDNVVVCCRAVRRGERLVAEGIDLVAREDVAMGHKLARHTFMTGDKVIKYGMSIGSMTASAAAGDWIHLHNMKSDFIDAHTRAMGRGDP
jgi:chorismate-pyruvate lyase